jgi:hypothetical protein
MKLNSKGQPRRKVTDDQARDIRENRQGMTQRQLADKHGLSVAGVAYVKHHATGY